MARRVAIVNQRKDRSITPEKELAMYIKRDTGLEIDPRVLRDFIVGRFTTISILAHEMWDPTRPPGHPHE